MIKIITAIILCLSTSAFAQSSMDQSYMSNSSLEAMQETHPQTLQIGPNLKTIKVNGFIHPIDKILMRSKPFMASYNSFGKQNNSTINKFIGFSNQKNDQQAEIIELKKQVSELKQDYSELKKDLSKLIEIIERAVTKPEPVK